MKRSADYWAVIPAAGAGRRMGSKVPKQYLELGRRPAIEYSLDLFLGHPRISGVLVCLDPGDTYWPRIAFAEHPRVQTVAGGAERCHSVLNALEVLTQQVGQDVWVLVHDAARPCLRSDDLDRLLEAVAEHPVGALLGVPVRDTMKRIATGGRVLATLPRDDLWHAYTPQVFRLGLLRRALCAILEQGGLVTDDAGAIERMGLEPLLVEGHADNIKITRPQDLPLAAFNLRQQGRLGQC